MCLSLLFLRKVNSSYAHTDLWSLIWQPRPERSEFNRGPLVKVGYQMVAWKTQLILFSGFQESAKNYICYNNMHAFKLDTFIWRKRPPWRTRPTPRLGSQVSITSQGSIIVYWKQSTKVDKHNLHLDVLQLKSEEEEQSNGCRLRLILGEYSSPLDMAFWWLLPWIIRHCFLQWVRKRKRAWQVISLTTCSSVVLQRATGLWTAEGT